MKSDLTEEWEAHYRQSDPKGAKMQSEALLEWLSQFCLYDLFLLKLLWAFVNMVTLFLGEFPNFTEQ